MDAKIFKVDSPKGEIFIIRLVNQSGCTVELSNLGAGITKIMVPDKRGHIGDVVLGYADYVDYLYDAPCAGKTPGRYANRIANGKFSIDGTEYQLKSITHRMRFMVEQMVSTMFCGIWSSIQLSHGAFPLIAMQRYAVFF